MNMERIKEWASDVSNGKWCYTNEMVNIGHSRCFNTLGTMCEFYLIINKKKWSDYLLTTVDMYDFKKKYDKYIYEDSIDRAVLLKEVFDWFDIDERFFDCINGINEGFFHEIYLIKKQNNLLTN